VHHDLSVFRELLVLAGVSLAIVLVFHRLRLPAVVGFIATGVCIGPGGFGLVGDPALVRTLAEIGVVLLLFTVGLEFSVADLRALGRTTLVAGLLQVAFTVAGVAAVLAAAGADPASAVFFGMLVSLSSTAMVLKLLTDRAELSAPHGRLATGVTVLQDALVLPFALLVPLLARWQRGGASPPPVGLPELLGGLAFLAGVALALLTAQRAIPWVLGRASRAGSREAFLFGVLLVVLGSAALAHWAGVSLALGAFVAGILLARSELKAQIAADVLPFRDALASVFFIAIGMSLEPRAAFAEPLVAAAATAGLVTAKVGAGLLALRLAGAPWRVAMAAALAIGQIGEFSFVLAQAGAPLGLLGERGAQAFTAGAVFSLMLTPLLVSRAGDWALAFELWRAGARGGAAGAAGGGGGPDADDGASPRSELRHDHVVIAGFGLNGRNVARVLRATRLPHVVLDLDPELLAVAGQDGSPVLLGDVTSALIQKQAGVPRARVLVVAVSDPPATRRAVRIARSLSRDVFIVVRTRLVAEIDELHALGANLVIPEEFETSIEIFTAVLREFHVPANVVQAQVALLRQERYSLLRGRRLPGHVVEQLSEILEAGATDTFLILQASAAPGRTLADLGLAGDGDPRVVAVVRGGHAIAEPPGDFTVRVGDTLVLTGSHGGIDRAFARLSGPREPAPAAALAPGP